MAQPGSTSAYTYNANRQPGKSLGYSTSRGQYSVSTTTPVQNNKQYSIKGFFKETLFGGLMGGLSGAAFYGGGKVVDKIKRSVYSLDGHTPLDLMIVDGEVIERAYKNAGKSTPELFKVVGHGNSKGIAFRGRVLNAKEVAMPI